MHAYEIRQAAPSIRSFPRALSILAHYSLGLDAAECPCYMQACVGCGEGAECCNQTSRHDIPDITLAAMPESFSKASLSKSLFKADPVFRFGSARKWTATQSIPCPNLISLGYLDTMKKCFPLQTNHLGHRNYLNRCLTSTISVSSCKQERMGSTILSSDETDLNLQAQSTTAS